MWLLGYFYYYNLHSRRYSLYSSNQIVLFYDSNILFYNKLGHINLSKCELTDLLGDEDVVITLSLE